MPDLDAVSAKEVPSDTATDVAVTGSDPYEHTSREGGLDMPDWQSIEDDLRDYITSLNGAHTPFAANAGTIAREAVAEASTVIGDPIPCQDASAAKALAYEKAKRKMACTLDWRAVTGAVGYHLRRTRHFLQEADVEDLSQAACEIAFEKWDPDKENNWSSPGCNLAKGVARILAMNLGGAPLPLPPAVPGPAPNLPGTLQRLDDDINEWLKVLSPEVGVAFVAYLVYGLPRDLCWVIVRTAYPGRSVTSYGAAWYRTYYQLLESLKQHLEAKGWP